MCRHAGYVVAIASLLASNITAWRFFALIDIQREGRGGEKKGGGGERLTYQKSYGFLTLQNFAKILSVSLDDGRLGVMLSIVCFRLV